MATIQCTASLGDLRSTWSTGFARQGRYSTTHNIGLLVFPSLANHFMAGKQIVDISMRFVSAEAGSNRNKRAYFHRSSRTTFSGGTGGLVGDYLGYISGTFYGNTVTVSSLKTSYASVFSAFKAYLESGGRAMALYRDERPNDYTWSDNYLQFNAVVMTIEYVESHVWCWDANAGEWKRCRAHFRRDGQWIPCNTYRHNATEWEL